MFQVPVQMKIDRLGLFFSVANGGDGTLTLYDSDGTTELVSVVIDNDAVVAQGNPRCFEICFEPVTLAANTNYRFAFVGTTTTNTTIFYGDVNAAGHMDGLILGQNAHWTQSATSPPTAPAWAETTTRRPLFGIGISAVHDGSGAAASGGSQLLVIRRR